MPSFSREFELDFDAVNGRDEGVVGRKPRHNTMATSDLQRLRKKPPEETSPELQPITRPKSFSISWRFPIKKPNFSAASRSSSGSSSGKKLSFALPSDHQSSACSAAGTAANVSTDESQLLATMDAFSQSDLLNRSGDHRSAENASSNVDVVFEAATPLSETPPSMKGGHGGLMTSTSSSISSASSSGGNSSGKKKSVASAGCDNGARDDASTHSRSSSPKLLHDKKDRKARESASSSSTGIGRSLKNFLNPNYKSRYEQFRKLFKGIPESDKFVIDYSCAFQREILVHGRMYLTQHNVCFYANIFKWETCLTIPFKDITHITKERTAKVIPNAIQMLTSNGDKYFFATFGSRDKSYMMIFRLWQLALLEKTTTPQEMWTWAQHGYQEADLSVSDDDDEISSVRTDMSLPPLRDNNNHLDSPRGHIPQVRSVPVLRSSGGLSSSPDMGRPDSEFPIAIPLPSSITEEEVASDSSENDGVELNCPCTSHSGKQLLDSVYPLSVDQMFILLFTESPWYHQFAATVKKTAQARLFAGISGFSATTWRMDDDDMALKMRTVSYTMALNHAMAPKTTTATEKQTCHQYGKAGQIYVVHAETQNTGVPYADNFFVLVTYCITRVSANECRLKVHGGIVYKKSIWGIVKGFIEKGTYSGLEEHYTALDATLKAECAKLGLPAERAKAAAAASDSSPAPSMTVMKKTLKKKMPRSRSSSDENDKMLDALSSLPRAPTAIPPGVSSKSSSLSRRERMNAEAASILAAPHAKNARLEFYAKAILAVLCILLLLNCALFVRLAFMQPTTSCSHRLVDVLASSDKVDTEDLLKIYRMDRQHVALSSLERTIDSLNRVETQLLELKSSMDSARDQLQLQAQLKEMASNSAGKGAHLGSLHDEQ
uniref:VASt domain-containing protein n=1 Tax=Plectus sambesii TaxID=2011161 RepID=A0A914VS12_9BILA